MLMFGLFEMIFPVVFLTVFAMVLFTFIRGIAEWNKNNHSPRLTVPAKVTGKRQNTTHHRHPNAGDVSGAHGYHTTSNTAYYVTFQVDSGDRLELSVPGAEYGMLAEGDVGSLTFQGTRDLAFQRKV